MGQAYVSPQEALWTFNVSSRTWRQHFPSGVLLQPALARGLALANGRAYLLSTAHDEEGPMQVHELNLDTWHWRLLPRAGIVPSSAFGVTPVKVQVHTFVMALRAESSENHRLRTSAWSNTCFKPLHGV